MALVTADRVRDTSTTTGTGSFAISGTPPTGYRTFSSVCATSDTFLYFISNQGVAEWEVGQGTYSATNTVARTTVLSSSNAGAAVSFSAGTKDVVLTQTAERMVIGTGGIAFSGADVNLFRDGAAQTLALANGSSASALRIYNTTDQTGTNTAPTNYERGVFDWTTTSNVLTIGTQAGGSGTQRDIDVRYGTNLNIHQGSFGVVALKSAASAVQLYQSWGLAWGSGDAASTSPTAGMSLVAAKVLSFNDGTSGNANGWHQWGGQARVTSDFSVTSSIALTNVTGLSASVIAGRTYSFYAYLTCTCAVAGGVKAAIAGTCTATNIIYDGYTIDTNANKGQTNATALGSTVASTTTTATAGIVIEIQGTITVLAAGTLTVQFAQNTSSSTASVVKRGSYFTVYDMP